MSRRSVTWCKRVSDRHGLRIDHDRGTTVAAAAIRLTRSGGGSPASSLRTSTDCDGRRGPLAAVRFSSLSNVAARISYSAFSQVRSK